MLSNTQDFVAAKQVLAPLAARAADENVRVQAQRRLDQIAEYEKQRAEWDARAKTTRPSADTTAVNAESPVLVLKLRELKPGETRYSGRLATIECGPKGAGGQSRRRDRSRAPPNSTPSNSSRIGKTRRDGSNAGRGNRPVTCC
jgi:hypothetical protein